MDVAVHNDHFAQSFHGHVFHKTDLVSIWSWSLTLNHVDTKKRYIFVTPRILSLSLFLLPFCFKFCSFSRCSNLYCGSLLVAPTLSTFVIVLSLFFHVIRTTIRNHDYSWAIVFVHVLLSCRFPAHQSSNQSWFSQTCGGRAPQEPPLHTARYFFQIQFSKIFMVMQYQGEVGNQIVVMLQHLRTHQGIMGHKMSPSFPSEERADGLQ